MSAPLLPDLVREDLGEPVEVESGRLVYFCPFHDDKRTPNLKLSEHGGKWRYKCWACGQAGDAQDYLQLKRGMSKAEAFKYLQNGDGAGYTVGPDAFGKPEQPEFEHGPNYWDWPVEAEYIWTDKDEQPVLKHIKHVTRRLSDGTRKKAFPWERREGRAWIKKPKGEKLPGLIYRLPDMYEWPDDVVYVPEGEKDVETLVKHGLLATTLHSGEWPAELLDLVKGRHMVFLRDYDQVGLQQAEQRARSVLGVAASVKVVLPPRLQEDGEDVTDYFERYDGDMDELVVYCAQADEWEPETAVEDAVAWEVLSLEDAYKPQPPTEWLIKGIIERGGLITVFGAPGDLKTLSVQDAAACIVSGQPWLPGAGDDGKGFATKQAPVLWLDIDNGRKRTTERIAAVSRAHSLAVDAPFHYVSMPRPAFVADGSDPAVVNYLISLIRQLQVELLVIDNLSQISGSVDQNTAEMKRVMGTLRDIAESTGVAIVIIHHQRKGKGDGKSRAGDSLAGSFAIEASLDLALLVMREPKSNTIMIKSTKTRGVDVPTVGAKFYYTHKPGTEDLETAWFKGEQVASTDMDVKDLVVKLAEHHDGINKGRLIDIVKDSLGEKAPGVNRVRDLINDMLAKGDGIVEVQSEQDKRYKLIKVNYDLE